MLFSLTLLGVKITFLFPISWWKGSGAGAHFVTLTGSEEEPGCALSGKQAKISPETAELDRGD